MSVCTRAIVAPSTAVAVPTTATTVIAVGDRLKRAARRATMYTPAVTMVAAWMRAETGVGPSMASGSQTCSGNCALLPQAPTNRRRQTVVMGPNCQSDSSVSEVALLTRSTRSSVPKRWKARIIPRISPTSPIRFTMKAFLPASAALFFVNQKPMSR